jgi:arylsulfatase A-like enzyme
MNTVAKLVVMFWLAAGPAISPAAVDRSTRPPNVVLILADDLGFSDIGCYGGEIATPNLDRLAAGGLRLTQMYNTARCWPSRACLLTGYYAQQVNRDPARPRPSWAALLPDLLKPAGYRSYHSGKWHVDGKVLEGGFDRSYWFEDYNRYFTPKTHFLDDKPLPAAKSEDGFYATTAMAQHAIDFLAEHDANHREQPFFLYLAFIAPHFPLHALPEDIERYQDRYLVGWDVIRQQRWQRLRQAGILRNDLSALDSKFTPRYLKPDLLEKIGPGESEHAVLWKNLTPEQQRFQATKMAIHAAMVDRMDREIGRVLEQLRKMDAWENTLMVFLSDNGADATLLVRGDGHDPGAPPGSAASFLCLQVMEGGAWGTRRKEFPRPRTTSVMAAATVAARVGIKIFGPRHAAELQRLGDVFVDGILNLVHRFLGIEEAARHRIVEQRVALLLELADLLAAERQRPLLFFVQHLALRHHGFILAAGLFIRHERINALADRTHVRLGENGVAQFPRLLDDGMFFGLSEHKYFLCRTRERHGGCQ